MLSNTKKTILSISLSLFLVACGSSSSSDGKSDNSGANNNNPSNNANNDSLNMGDKNSTFDTTDLNDRVKEIRKGFYVDSAVKGVDYSCGDQNGTTDSNGTFRFEEGKKCIFTLGNILLREFNTTKLENNVVIIEKNIDNARLLQTLDNDANPANGIEITREVLDVIKESGNKIVPIGDDELRPIFRNAQTAEGYDGAMVTIQEAQTHIQETLSGLGLDDYLDSLDSLSGMLDNNDSFFLGN